MNDHKFELVKAINYEDDSIIEYEVCEDCGIDKMIATDKCIYEEV